MAWWKLPLAAYSNSNVVCKTLTDISKQLFASVALSAFCACGSVGGKLRRKKMNPIWKTRGIAVGLLAILTVLVPAAMNSRAQEQKPPTLPLAEMQRLSKLYVGTWTYTETYPKSASSPNGGVNTGVYT